MLPPDDLAGALQAALEPDPRPVPAAGDRLAAVLALTDALKEALRDAADSDDEVAMLPTS